MWGLRMQEILLIIGVLMLFFGVKRLPQLGKNIGEGIRNFKQSFKELRSDDDEGDEGEVKNG